MPIAGLTEFDYEFRILIETESGRQYSYGTSSLVNVDVNRSKVITTEDMVSRINTLPSMSYYNAPAFTTGSGLYIEAPAQTWSDNVLNASKKTPEFGETRIGGKLSTTGDYQYVSCSIKDDNLSGSIVFHSNPDFDRKTTILFAGTMPEADLPLKRYKFWGNKVCQVLGLPENYWIYSDKFRLSNTGSEANYVTGDILATSLNLKTNLAINNAGSITSDLPFRHFKEADRYVRWTDISSSIPTNKMLIGYNQHRDEYGIEMPTGGMTLHLSSSVISCSGDLLVAGNILAQNAAGDGYIDTLLVSDTGSFITEVAAGASQGTLSKTSAESVGAAISLTDLTTTGNPIFNSITASANISASGELIVNTISASSHITASGNIQMTAGSVDGGFLVFNENAAFTMGFPTTDYITYSATKSELQIKSDKIHADGHLYVTGEISSSHPLHINDSTANIAMGDSVVGSMDGIFVEGDISASGNLYVDGDSYGPIPKLFELSTGGSGAIWFKLGSLAGTGARVSFKVVGQHDYGNAETFITEGNFSIGGDVDEYGLTQWTRGDYSGNQNVLFEYVDTGDNNIDCYMQANSYSRLSVYVFDGLGFTINPSADAQLSDPSGVNATEKFLIHDNVGIGTTTAPHTLTVDGTISSSGAITIGPTSPGEDVGIKWRVFTGTTGNTGTTTAVTHGITNGMKRIVGVNFNVQTQPGAAKPSGISDESFIAGGASYQDETDEDREFQCWYDDDSIFIHIEASATDIDNEPYTMIVHFANADLY